MNITLKWPETVDIGPISAPLKPPRCLEERVELHVQGIQVAERMVPHMHSRPRAFIVKAQQLPLGLGAWLKAHRLQEVSQVRLVDGVAVGVSPQDVPEDLLLSATGGRGVHGREASFGDTVDKKFLLAVGMPAGLEA